MDVGALGVILVKRAQAAHVPTSGSGRDGEHKSSDNREERGVHREVRRWTSNDCERAFDLGLLESPCVCSYTSARAARTSTQAVLRRQGPCRPRSRVHGLRTATTLEHLSVTGLTSFRLQYRASGHWLLYTKRTIIPGTRSIRGRYTRTWLAPRRDGAQGRLVRPVTLGQSNESVKDVVRLRFETIGGAMG